MKKKKLRRIFSSIFLIGSISLLVGCTKKEQDILENEVSLNYGAFVDELSNETYNFTDEESVKKVDTDSKIINNFNKSSNTYTFFKDGSYYVNYNSEDIKIDHSKVLNLKISPNGQYVFYFINEEYLKPMVMNLKKKEESELGNKAVISGQFIDWFDDSKVAFYGINNYDKSSGIFTYDISSNEEKLIYKVNGGYVQFIKHIKNGIAFVQEHYGEEASLKIIDLNNEAVEVCQNIMEISDVEVIEDVVYILGRMKDNVYSIYEIKDGSVNRITYDFPSNIHIDKGLSVNENGELLFAGSNDNSEIDNIYKYYDESISLVFEGSGEYNFINVQ